MQGPSQDAQPEDESPGREWILRDVILLAFMAIFLFAVVFWAALGKPPVSGTTVVAVLGFAFIILANLSLGALAAGTVIEIRHRDWSRFRDIDYVFIGAALVVLLVVDAGFAWWLFSSDPGGRTRWLFLAVALILIVAGALWSWPAMLSRHRDRRSSRALWPQRGESGQPEGPWPLFLLLSALLGAALGVVVAVGYLGISAWHENVDVPAGHQMPASLTGIHGSYIAIGDSYSAGEGLMPFVPGTAATQCDRSVSFAFPDLLFRLLQAHDHQAAFRFTACSSALVHDVRYLTHRPGGVVPPQITGQIQRSVGLVTLTIGGNNAIFSKVVLACLTSGDCLEQDFPPAGVHEATAKRVPPGVLLTQWGPATIEEIGSEDGMLFATLRRNFPNARIIVIGYPYLFSNLPAPGFPYFPPMCASILNRLSAHERQGIRTLQDEFNNRIYEEAVVSGIEFVSPVAIWDGHEPCGANGQYTNSVKPYLNFPNPINGGSFHPNAAGQQTLAALVACYVDQYPTPPDPFEPGAPHIRALPSQLANPEQLHMLPAPGLDSVPGSGTIHQC